MNSLEKIKGGLNKLPADERDYSHSKVFGSIPSVMLPEHEFYVSSPIGIKDQGSSDFCTAYASCAVSEDQEGVLLNPQFIFMKSKELSGDPDAWGQDLRVVCKAHVKFGTIEQQYYPYLNRPDTPREDLVNSKSWSDDDLAPLAYEHRKNSFFSVDGPYDTFDNFRMVLWQNMKDSRSIVTGSNWYDEWTKSASGIIPKEKFSSTACGHAFKIFGQKIINGEIYLVAQLSNGPEIGDQGLFYFPRDVVNREFIYGAFTFKDMAKDAAAYHSYYGISVNDKFFTKLRKVIGALFTNKK